VCAAYYLSLTFQDARAGVEVLLPVGAGGPGEQHDQQPSHLQPLYVWYGTAYTAVNIWPPPSSRPHSFDIDICLPPEAYIFPPHAVLPLFLHPSLRTLLLVIFVGGGVGVGWGYILK
jgi:hypothetical protein